MGDRGLVGAGMIGAVIAVTCCAGPLLVVAVPLAGLGVWLGGGLVGLALVLAGPFVWVIHRQMKVVSRKARMYNESVKQ
jgi:hypothetical protein